MGARDEHRRWAEEHAKLAEQLSDGDDPSKRWAVVLAYYSVLHTVSAIADEVLSEHPEDHPEIIKLPRRMKLPDYQGLERRIQESYNYANRARYLRGSGAKADTWFLPIAHSASMLVDMALTMMRDLNVDLAKAVGWDGS